MFSKALFKQSCKANGTMWSIITAAVCFMLACVMLISGNGNIGNVKNGIQDTIITQEIEAQMQKRAVSYYNDAESGLEKFDEAFTDGVSETLSYLAWCSEMPRRTDFASVEEYTAAVAVWQAKKPTVLTAAGKKFAAEIEEYQSSAPQKDNLSDEEYASLTAKYYASSPATEENAVAAAYVAACDSVTSYAQDLAALRGYGAESTEAAEILGCIMYALNPNGSFNDFYTANGENAPDDYDVTSLISALFASGADKSDTLEAHEEYRRDRSARASAIFLAANMTKSESVDALVEALSSYGVTKEKFDGFGYTYPTVKLTAQNAIVTFRGRLDNAIESINAERDTGKYASDAEYAAAIETKRNEIAEAVSSSFLSTLPSEVSLALEEIGKADLYTLIVGSIFYKLAGLLLPIIYMIMASNNLISGQVDSGSMAYILSTSTKRSTVAFTQGVYLIGSLLSMFLLTTATGCVCLAFVSEDVGLGYGELVLLNVGAFLVLLALSGLCFFTSCVFDRSKRSMAIGGGLSVFALVAAMLGLFGSPVIPSVVRLDALNNFNYTTVISLFDVVSIIDGTNAFIFKFAILAVAGIIGYVVGAFVFTKKDLPL